MQGAAKRAAEPRLGPLPAPGLVERLRTSWSLAALVPAFDPRELRKREWRSAAALAVAVHAVVLVAIVVGKYVLPPIGPDPERTEITILKPGEIEPPKPVEKTGDDAGGQKTDAPATDGAEGGG